VKLARHARERAAAGIKYLHQLTRVRSLLREVVVRVPEGADAPPDAVVPARYRLLAWTERIRLGANVA
jgi:hypothetical protein